MAVRGPVSKQLANFSFDLNLGFRVAGSYREQKARHVLVLTRYNPPTHPLLPEENLSGPPGTAALARDSHSKPSVFRDAKI